MEKQKCLQLMKLLRKLIVYNWGDTKMNKYNVKILDEAKDDIKEIIIYINKIKRAWNC